MARYIGPKIKISRRFGVKLGLRTNEEAFTRRPFKPGEHGPRGRRSRVTEYGTQLAEKQKAKFIYGVLERQFARYFKMASKSHNAGLTLLQILETRLDTVVFRGGFTQTQSQARQFVTHGHVTVNGKKVSIPSFVVEPGMKIALTSSIQKTVDDAPVPTGEIPVWLRKDSKGIEVLAQPTREQIPSIVNEQLIVEFYSR